VEDPDIWTASKLISAPATDGGKARIPMLKHKVDGQESLACSNEEKSLTLAKCFFPAKPEEDSTQPVHRYPQQCTKNTKIMAEQVHNRIKRLKPYKALGPDGIPNIVLTKCADILEVRLVNIYEGIFEHSLMYKPWKSFTTIVLRKPGKPRL